MTLVTLLVILILFLPLVLQHVSRFFQDLDLEGWSGTAVAF